MSYPPSINITDVPDLADDLISGNVVVGPLLGLRSRFIKGIRWNFVAAVAAQGGTYLVNIILARVLQRHAFGEYAIIQNTLLTASMIAQVGTGLTATKYVAEFRQRDKPRAGRILGLCLVVSAIASTLVAIGLIAAAEPLARVMLAASTLAPALMLGAGILVFSGMNGSQVGALAGLESYGPLARATVLTSTLTIGLTWVGAGRSGLNGALLGLLAAAAAQWVILRMTLGAELSAHGISITLTGLKSERKVLLKFAIPAAISGLVSMPALWLANTFLVHQPDGFSQMALFSAAASTKSLMLFLPNIVNSVGTSLLNNERGGGTETRYRKVFWANLALATATALAGAVLMALLARVLLSPFGKSFVDGQTILRILIIGGVIEAAMAAVYQIIQAHEKMFFSLLCIAIPRDLLIVTLSWFLIPMYGARGLALAYTLGWFVASFVYVAGAARIGLSPHTA